ncbi:hypothetical protein ACEUC3_14945 [Aeromonas bivalvium]|uniref:hypothetical protein n=1 Tax=Aeromonas bivalvium TaxID=440079 RepID=UPI0038D210EE
MIQDNLQLFSFKFSNLPGCCGSIPSSKQGVEPADFWQIGRILLKNDVISTSFHKRNASKFNKKATLPIIYAVDRNATPSNKRKYHPGHQGDTLRQPNCKNQIKSKQ